MQIVSKITSKANYHRCYGNRIKVYLRYVIGLLDIVLAIIAVTLILIKVCVHVRYMNLNYHDCNQYQHGHQYILNPSEN